MSSIYNKRDLQVYKEELTLADNNVAALVSAVEKTELIRYLVLTLAIGLVVSGGILAHHYGMSQMMKFAAGCSMVTVGGMTMTVVAFHYFLVDSVRKHQLQEARLQKMRLEGEKVSEEELIKQLASSSPAVVHAQLDTLDLDVKKRILAKVAVDPNYAQLFLIVANRQEMIPHLTQELAWRALSGEVTHLTNLIHVVKNGELLSWIDKLEVPRVALLGVHSKELIQMIETSPAIGYAKLIPLKRLFYQTADKRAFLKAISDKTLRNDLLEMIVLHEFDLYKLAWEKREAYDDSLLKMISKRFKSVLVERLEKILASLRPKSGDAAKEKFLGAWLKQLLGDAYFSDLELHLLNGGHAQQGALKRINNKLGR